MGHDRSLVRHAFEDDNSVIDTKEEFLSMPLILLLPKVN